MDYLDSKDLRITVPVGFKVASPTPIDSRLVVNNMEELHSISGNNLAYYGLTSYCKDDDTIYKYTRHGWVSTAKTDNVVSYFSLVAPERDDNGTVTKKGLLSINTKAGTDFAIQSMENINFTALNDFAINADVVAIATKQYLSITAVNSLITGEKELYLKTPKLEIRNGVRVPSQADGPAPVTVELNGNLNITHHMMVAAITTDYLNIAVSGRPDIKIGGVAKSFNGHSNVEFSHSDVATILDNTSGYNLSNKLKAKSGNHVAWATLTAAGWAGSAAPYTQTVTVAGITDENPMLISGLSDGASATTQAAYVKAFGIICSGTGTFDVPTQRATFKVYKKPATDCRIGLKG